MSWFSAYPPSQRWATALTALVTATAVPVHAQSHKHKRDKTEDEHAPIVVRAEEITGRPEREVNLERDVELVRGQTVLKADTACYKMVEDEVSAKGHVRMWRFGDQYKGDELKLNLESGKGWVLRPEYRMEFNNAQGKAARIDFLSEEEAQVTDGTYSTCEGPNPDWYLKSSTLRLDEGRDVGVAGKTVVYFKGVPIIGTPAMSFSLSGARRSGWLPPSIDVRSKGGAELMVPYYVNIAPNRDLTWYPRLFANRGLQIGATARYLGESYTGQTHAEVLMNDRQSHSDRWFINSTHSQTITTGLGFGWNVRAASDDNYPSDFSRSISGSAERQLLRELRTDYITQYWSMSARLQNYQVLQDPAAATNPALSVPRPYDRLPQLNFHTGRYDVGGFDWSIDAEATRFSHPTQLEGDREVVQPQISYPWVRPGYFITPKMMVHASRYQLDQAGTAPSALSRTVPTFSLDSGLVFERDTTVSGRSMTQTLEPRLFYVKTPYKDQSAFPNFDSAEAGFNFAQLYSENRFIGQDRIADANQLTAAVVSRFVEANGAERLRLAIGQRYYFEDQRVLLDASEPRVDRHSDLLLAGSGRIAENWSFDSAVQYNVGASQVYSANYGMQWMPAAKKVLNAEYRYLRDSFKNADISSQWPLSQRLYGVARVSYSLRDRKVLESLLALEYKADCWVFRTGGQRFVTAAQNTSTKLFFQLELNGLSTIGTPAEQFSKSVPGYTRLNPDSRR